MSFEDRTARGIFYVDRLFSSYCRFELLRCSKMYLFTEHDLAQIALLRRMWWHSYVPELTRLVAAFPVGEDGHGQLRRPSAQ